MLSPEKIDVSPQLILALLVPPLVFDAAFHIRLDDLRRDFWLILLLAVPGVILTTFLAGWLVAQGTGLAMPVALVFGALVSATDPVAVVALFRRLGAPRRLQVLLEGESLFNDGTAIVMFSLTVAIVLSGQFSLAGNIANFLTVAGGGLLVGITLGMLASEMIRRIDEPLVETTLTVVLAFGAYLLAESLHVSGVLAVVAAGLVNGNAGPRGMSPTTRIVVYQFLGDRGIPGQLVRLSARGLCDRPQPIGHELEGHRLGHPGGAGGACAWRSTASPSSASRSQPTGSISCTGAGCAARSCWRWR